MADIENGNGERKRIEAVARNIALQGYARVSMVVFPPFVGALVAIAGWFFADLTGEVKSMRRELTAYITKDTADGARQAGRIDEHERRLGVVEGRVFGFTPMRPQPTSGNP
jgi:hypothetical protein